MVQSLVSGGLSIVTVSETPANQTTTSTTDTTIRIANHRLSEVVRARIPLKAFVAATLSNSGANDTDMNMIIGNDTTLMCDTLRHNGTGTRASESATFTLSTTQTGAKTTVTDDDPVITIVLRGLVAAGTGTFASITIGLLCLA